MVEDISIRSAGAKAVERGDVAGLVAESAPRLPSLVCSPAPAHEESLVRFGVQGVTDLSLQEAICRRGRVWLEKFVMSSVAALEVPHRFGESHGAARMDRADLPGAELVVLPEACLTGYVAVGGDGDLTRFAEERGRADRAGPLRAGAKKRARAAGAADRARGGRLVTTRALFIDSSGEVLVSYRKRHPWMLESWATPGEESAAAALRMARADLDHRDLLRCAISCCKMESDRSRPPDALLFPSAWIRVSPGDARRALARAGPPLRPAR